MYLHVCVVYSMQYPEIYYYLDNKNYYLYHDNEVLIIVIYSSKKIWTYIHIAKCPYSYLIFICDYM